MKLGTKLALSTALVAAVAVGSTGVCSNDSNARHAQDAAAGSYMTRRSVIKVHTDHGVITLPGTVDSWDAVENAVFVADSIADVQIVNNEVPWRISNN